ncbi:hypothetical protein EMCRGX_G000270 [Ephydatia muelleri]
MSLRLLSANWGPPTHACITFDDGSTSVVPTKNIVNQSNLKVNGVCEVKWTDGKVYYATIVALGRREKMEAKLAEMAEDTEKEDQRSGGSEVKQKGSSAVASTSKVSQTANCPTQRRLDAKRKRSQSEEVLKKSAQLLQHLSQRADIMQLKAQVLCLQKQVTYLLTIKAQTESTDSSADQSSQCGSDASKIRIKGCWLGDPNGEKVWVPEGDAKKVLAAEVVSDTAAKLALALLSVFFTDQEMARSNCTPAPSRQLLNPNIISGIHRHIKYKFPQTNEQQWQKILHVNMNSKCRSLRNKEKRKQCEESVTKTGVQADRGVHCRTDGDVGVHGHTDGDVGVYGHTDGDVGVHGHTDGDVDSSGDEADGGLLGSRANL